MKDRRVKGIERKGERKGEKGRERGDMLKERKIKGEKGEREIK